MTDLSPAAQAVLDAVGRKTWYRNDDIVAALRAAADGCRSDWMGLTVIHHLYAIAAELESTP